MCDVWTSVDAVERTALIRPFYTLMLLEEVQHMHAQIESVVDSAYKEFKEAQVERTGAGKEEKGSCPRIDL